MLHRPVESAVASGHRRIPTVNLLLMTAVDPVPSFEILNCRFQSSRSRRAPGRARTRPRAAGTSMVTSSVEEQGGLPRSSTSQNQRRNEPPQPCRSAYRASGSVPWPTADHPNDCLPSVGDLQLMKLLAGLMSVANAIGSEWAAHQRRLTLASFGVLHRRSSSRSRPAPAVPRHLPSALPTVRSPHAVRRP